MICPEDDELTGKRDDDNPSQWVKDVAAGLYDPEPEEDNT
jgi:hypothetical protein